MYFLVNININIYIYTILLHTIGRNFLHNNYSVYIMVICSTIVELAILLLTVDNIEDIWNISLHVANFKIKPLMMASGVDIWHEDQVILFRRNLKYAVKNNIILLHGDSGTEGYSRQYIVSQLQCSSKAYL